MRQRGLHDFTALVHPVSARQNPHRARRVAVNRHDALRRGLFRIGLLLFSVRDLRPQIGELRRDLLERRVELLLLRGGALLRRDFKNFRDVLRWKRIVRRAHWLRSSRRTQAQIRDLVIFAPGKCESERQHRVCVSNRLGQFEE